MAITTWSFTSDYEGWTFKDIGADISVNPCPNCSASRSHVPGAMRTTLVVDSLPFVTAAGLHTSPGLGATIANLDTIAVDYGATSDASNTAILITATYTDDTTETTTVTDSGASTLTLTLTQNKTLDDITIRDARSTSGTAIGSTNTRDILEVRLTSATPFTGTGQKPLGVDVDLEGGDKIYVTLWDGDLAGDLLLKEFNSSLVLQNTYTIANNTADIIDIYDRTFFLSPYTPAFFGTANLDDIVYIYGRWDDGAVKHLAKSTDGGASFANIGDSATWGADWVGGFFADDANTLYAFVNGVSPALYRSINAGSSWSNLSTLPFDVDPHGVSKHADGRILIANRINAAQMAAFATSPNYASWTNATGSPAFSTVGSGARSVIWVT